MRLSTLNKILLLIALLGLGLLGFNQEGLTLAQEASPTLTITPLQTLAPSCQNYRLTVPQGRIRACPFDTCDVVSGATSRDGICVVGVAQENPEWYIVDLDAQGKSDNIGYVHRSIVEPGRPGVESSLFPSCDAWLGGTDNIAVRSCAKQECNTVAELNTNDLVCAESYGGDPEYYYLINQASSGITGWVEGKTIEYSYNEGLNCANDDSWITLADSKVRECSQITCPVVSTLPAGQAFCVTGEAEGRGAWIQITMADGQVGWVSTLTLNKLDDNELEATQQANTIDLANIGPTDIAPLVTQQTASGTAVAQLDPLATLTPLNPPLSICPTVVVGFQTEGNVTQPLPDFENCITATPAFVSSFTTLTPEPTVAASGPVLSQDIRLSELFIDNIDLQSPQGTARFFFQTPANWSPTGSNLLFLDLSYFEDYISSLNLETGRLLATQFDVRLDDQLIASLSLDADDVGEQVVPILLPNNLLADKNRQVHEIALTLSAFDHCLVDSKTRIISDTTKSYFHFEYQKFPPQLDLAQYPQPIFTNPIGPNLDAAWIVLPDDPGEADLQALASVSAGLGLLSGNRLRLNAVSASQLTDITRATENLILIGTIEDNELIKSLYEADLLPTRFNESGHTFLGETIDPDDGVIALVKNPENEQKAVIVVTGETEAALDKASKGLSGRASVLGFGGPVIIIEDLNPRTVALTKYSEHIKLSELGFTNNLLLTGAGIQTLDIEFELPPGGRLDNNAFIDLIYNYSASIETPNATVTILINDTPIASAYLKREGSANELLDNQFDFQRLQAFIPPGVILFGQKNLLQILVDMRGGWECSAPNDSAIWFVISNQSELFLPRVDNITSINDLALIEQFPSPYDDSSDLSNTIMSLSEHPSPAEITQLSRIMAALGTATDGSVRLNPTITLGLPDNWDELDTQNLIVLGRPSTNSTFSKINDSLPQPFVEGEDNLEQVLENVTYRILPGFNVGVLETLPAPWNPSKSIMVITGTDEVGQDYAVNALLNSNRAFDLGGNIVFASASKSSAVDTRYIYAGTEILEAALQSMITPTPNLTPSVIPTFTPVGGENSVVVSVTPISSPTLVTPQSLDFNSIFITSTPLPTLMPTVIATFIPLSEDQLLEQAIAKPVWFDLIIVVTVVFINLVIIFILYRLLRRWMKRS